MTEHRNQTAQMRMLVAKFPNSKPIEVSFHPLMNAAIVEKSLSPREPVSIKYKKREKSPVHNIDLTQLENLYARRGGGCAANSPNGSNFQDHFGFFPEIQSKSKPN